MDDLSWVYLFQAPWTVIHKSYKCLQGQDGERPVLASHESVTDNRVFTLPDAQVVVPQDLIIG